jgi:outer membrane protein assembly factor BamB
LGTCRLIINFLNTDAIYTTALDLDGKQLWQTKVSEFLQREPLLLAVSILHEQLTISAASNELITASTNTEAHR